MPDDTKKETNEVSNDELEDVAGGLMGPPDDTPKKCSVPGCDFDAQWEGLCAYHYMKKVTG